MTVNVGRLCLTMIDIDRQGHELQEGYTSYVGHVGGTTMISCILFLKRTPFRDLAIPKATGSYRWCFL